jgi:ubiquinone/menaquinone biosynthesis C-methylase UbiE
VSSVIAFEPHRFQSAARYYVEGRPAYAAQLIGRLSGLLGFSGTQRLLDLGTGPGQLAIAFAPYVGEVIAIDPEPEMLRIAGEQAAKAGARITLLEGSSYTLDDSLGSLDFVTIGRAFHWMDRPRTLAILDGLIKSGGSVALFSTRHPNVPQNAWLKDFDSLLQRYAEPDPAHKIRRSPQWSPNEAVLIDSPFPKLERLSVIERRRTPLEQFVVRALSRSSTSPGRIGARAEELTQSLRSVLSQHAVDGAVQEVVETEALLASRAN